MFIKKFLNPIALFTVAISFDSSNGFSVKNNRVFVGTPVKPVRHKVSECMKTNLKTLTISSKVEDAIAMLIDAKISGAPVVDETGKKLLGIVSASDFIHKEVGDGILLPVSGSEQDIQTYIYTAKKVSEQGGNPELLFRFLHHFT